MTIGRSDTVLIAVYRRLAAWAGKAKAVTATARKVAVVFYKSLRHGMTYKIPVHRIMSSGTAPASSTTLRVEPSQSGIICKNCPQTLVWLFLKKPVIQ